MGRLFLEQETRFDPFNDRLSRDIRNELSTAMIEALDERDPKPVRRRAQAMLDRGLRPWIAAYVEDRLKRFETVLDEVNQTGAKDVPGQARLLWNRGLFFEAHERIETVYLSSRGEERKAYQGLIKAAGVYIHLERGAGPVARRLADKAAALLRRYGNRLPPDFNLALLLEKLETHDPRPPLL